MRIGRLNAALAACGYAFLLAPLLIVCVLSFTSGQYLSIPPPGFSSRWYGALAGNAELLRAALNSLVLGGTGTAVACWRPGRGWRWGISPSCCPSSSG